MKHLFVTYELALELNKRGFIPSAAAAFQTQENNRLVVHWFNKRDFVIAPHLLPAPTYQQVTDWLREKNIHVAASSFPVYNNKYGYQYQRGGSSSGWTPHFEGSTYYQALTKAIEEALNQYVPCTTQKQ